MDSLCISLVHQYLESTNSTLADQFKNKYQAHKTNVELKEVLSKWKEDQLVRGLVYRHLKLVAPYLAGEFRKRHSVSLESSPKYPIGDIWKKVWEINTRRSSKIEDENGAKQGQNDDKKNTITTEEQLVRGLVFQHLKTVAPALALEFRDRHSCSFQEITPKHHIKELQKKVLVIANTVEDASGREHKQKNDKKRKKMNTFTSEEVERIKQAMANAENIGTVAKEMGRTFKSLYYKILALRGGVKKTVFFLLLVKKLRPPPSPFFDHLSFF